MSRSRGAQPDRDARPRSLTALQEFETRLCYARKSEHTSLRAPVANLSGQSGHCFRLGAERLLQSLRSRAFACARWLVPQAQRFLVHRTGSHNQYRRVLKFAPDLSSLLHRIQSLKVAAGLLIVLVLLGSLDLVTRATVRISPELAQGPIFEPVPVSGTRLEAVPLPTRKPQVAYKIPKNKAAKAATQKRMAQRKSAKR